MLYSVARVLQLAGLLILPVAMVGNITEKLDLRQMLIVAGLGIGTFCLGWLLQQAVKK